jgi:hypothetical protein
MKAKSPFTDGWNESLSWPDIRGFIRIFQGMHCHDRIFEPEVPESKKKPKIGGSMHVERSFEDCYDWWRFQLYTGID